MGGGGGGGGGGGAPQDVTLRFQEQGADAAVAATNRVTEAAKKMEAAWSSAARAAAPLKDQASAVTVAAVQQASQVERSNTSISKSSEAVGQSTQGLNTRFRTTSRIAIGLASDLSGQLNPTLGKMASSLGVGVSAALAFGGAIGLAVAAVNLIVQAVQDWNEKSKANEEFQIRLSRALKTQDLGFVTGELEKLNIEMQKFGGNTDENRKKLEQLKQVFSAVFAQTEGPKLAREAQQATLEIQKQQAQFAMEQAKSVDDVTAAMQKQQTVASQLAEIQIQALEQESKSRAKQLRDTGFGKEATQVEASTKAKVDALRAGAALETEVLEKAGKDRVEALRQEAAERKRIEKELSDAILQQVTQFQDQQTAIAKTAGDIRLAILGTQKARESAAIELANTTSGRKIKDRSDLEVKYAEETKYQQVRLIDDEVAMLEKRKEMFKDNSDVQRQSDQRIIELQGARVQAEVAADGQIVAARKAMVEQLRQEADREAGLGESLTGKAIARLKARGRTKIDEQDIADEVSKARTQGAAAFGGLRTGGRVKISELEDAISNRGMFADMAAMGTNTGQAVSQFGARAAAAFGGQQWMPTTFAGQAIPELGDQIGGGPMGPAGGMPETQKLDNMFAGMKEKGNKVIDEMIQRVPGIMQEYFQKFSDELIRKLESEAART